MNEHRKTSSKKQFFIKTKEALGEIIGGITLFKYHSHILLRGSNLFTQQKFGHYN